MSLKNKKKYPKNSAGSLMVFDVPIVDEKMSVSDVEKLLTKRSGEFSTINYIYVVSKEGLLTGVFSIKELFRSPKNKKVQDLSLKKIFSVASSTKKARVAMIALKRSLKGVPVVDREKKFLGVVPSDVILEILYKEETKNLLKLSGVSQSAPYKGSILNQPLLVALKNRFPWLVIGLLGGIFAASIVSQFEEVLSRSILLAAYIPLIVYMSGAVCAQMQSFIIRDLSFDFNLKFSNYLYRQIGVVAVMAVANSFLLYFISFLIHKNPVISLVLAVSLFFAIVSALFSGLIIPFIFSRLKLDPANASGPIATIIQDVVSILVYFLVASAIL